MGSSTDDQQQQLHKQVSEPKSISDFIDLCLLVCRGIDYIKSDTNSEFPNVRCGILAPVCGISTDDQHQQLRKQVSEPKSISDFMDLYLPVCIGIDSIKSDTNSEFPNVRCGILAPVYGNRPTSPDQKKKTSEN